MHMFIHLFIIPLILLMVQVKLGGITVWFSNVHWSVAAHLGCALLFFASLILWRKKVGSPAQHTLPRVQTLTKLVLWLLAINVYGTMLMGAIISSSHAGGVCGGLFSCAGEWLPADIDQLHQENCQTPLCSIPYTYLAMFL